MGPLKKNKGGGMRLRDLHSFNKALLAKQSMTNSK